MDRPVQRVQKRTVHKRQWEIKKKLRAHILKADCGLKVHNAYFKLAFPNPGCVLTKGFGQKTFVGDQKKLPVQLLLNAHLKLALPISGYVPSKVFGQKGPN